MPSSEITRLLAAHRRGDRDALDRAMSLLYQELRGLAVARLRHEDSGHTLDPTALVHEAYLRLIGIHDIDWEGRRHFLSMACRVMRRILVDHARRRNAAKRGGAPKPVTLEEELWPDGTDAERVLEVHDALERLSRDHSRAAEAIELRFFAGLTVPEVAEVLDISPATAERDLRFARAWLARALRESTEGKTP